MEIIKNGKRNEKMAQYNRVWVTFVFYTKVLKINNWFFPLSVSEKNWFVFETLEYTNILCKYYYKMKLLCHFNTTIRAYQVVQMLSKCNINYLTDKK